MKIINLYGGPGTGKSRTAALLFGEMKFKGYNVELITEFAKEPTWDENHRLLSDQLYITASQHRRQFAVKDKVEWAVTDSPLLLGLAYAEYGYLNHHYTDLVWDLYEEYTNIDVPLTRINKYNPIGRNQTEAEAIEKDKLIIDILGTLDSYHTVKGTKKASKKILKIIEGK